MSSLGTINTSSSGEFHSPIINKSKGKFSSKYDKLLKQISEAAKRNKDDTNVEKEHLKTFSSNISTRKENPLKEEIFKAKLSFLTGKTLDSINYTTRKSIAKEKKDNLLLNLEIVIGIFSTLFVLNVVAIISLIEMETYLKVIILVSSIIIFIVGALFAIRIEQKAGYYECRHCKEHFEPAYGATFLAPHFMRLRLLKCPKCGKITLCKKVVKK